MGLKYTPKFNATKAPDFDLLGVDGARWNLAKAMGPKGLVVMFICNHCPYVKSIQTALVKDSQALIDMGIHVVGIMSNDTTQYPADDYPNMQAVAAQMGYPFAYLWDETQAVAKAYGAVCTPDIFAMDATGIIRYRGRLNAAGINDQATDLRRDLLLAMQEMIETGIVNSEQHPSMGCSIKWKEQE
ncbi:thioredoxin family protein [Marinicella meishanensis]|uniref:thioredoxin family protein n=1 Tax=Marinicella meishanensis TaxID=2873263 RepID=UPI001CC11D2C|nr:thioredoxin family protein [Marinicella sp. NBU2979]